MDNIDRLTNGLTVILTTAAVVFAAGVMDLLMAFPVKWAWNYTLVSLFNLPVINYWQTWSLLFLLCALWKVVPVAVETKK